MTFFDHFLATENFRSWMFRLWRPKSEFGSVDCLGFSTRSIAAGFRGSIWKFVGGDGFLNSGGVRFLGVAFGVRARAVIAHVFGISESGGLGWERYFLIW